MKTIKNLKQAYSFCNSYNKSHQITVQELLNGRLHHHTKGWSDIKLDYEFKKEVIEKVVDSLGGWNRTKSDIRYTLLNENRQHWGLDRFVVEWYKKIWKEPKIVYCAGQDQTWEMKEIRNALK